MKNILECSCPNFKTRHWKPSAQKEYISCENWWGTDTTHGHTGTGHTQSKKKTLKLQNIDYIGYIGIAFTELNYESTSIHKLAPVSSLQIKNTP